MSSCKSEGIFMDLLTGKKSSYYYDIRAGLTPTIIHTSNNYYSNSVYVYGGGGGVTNTQMGRCTPSIGGFSNFK